MCDGDSGDGIVVVKVTLVIVTVIVADVGIMKKN